MCIERGRSGGWAITTKDPRSRCGGGYSRYLPRGCTDLGLHQMWHGRMNEAVGETICGGIIVKNCFTVYNLPLVSVFCSGPDSVYIVYTAVVRSHPFRLCKFPDSRIACPSSPPRHPRRVGTTSLSSLRVKPSLSLGNKVRKIHTRSAAASCFCKDQS